MRPQMSNLHKMQNLLTDTAKIKSKKTFIVTFDGYTNATDVVYCNFQGFYTFLSIFAFLNI